MSSHLPPPPPPLLGDSPSFFSSMKVRQFVNVVTEKCTGRWPDAFADTVTGGVYSLLRIKAGNLFYGSTEEALLKEAEQEAMAADPCSKEMARSRLPNPLIKFDQSRLDDGRMEFWPFYGAANSGESSSKMVCVDAAGEAVLYDADAGTLGTLPRLRARMGSYPDPVTLTLALPDALYAMDQRGDSFEALVYGDPSMNLTGGRSADECAWRWRQLPKPPSTNSIGAYVLLPEPDGGGGGNICVSGWREQQGTYCFNTASERWAEVGSWTLPFHGRCEVVPEPSGLCFGVSREYTDQLCTMDLSSMSRYDGARRPKLRYRWTVMDTPPAGWTTNDISMVYMGAGKFCVAKSFHIYHEDNSESDETVLHGVEVVREDGRWTSKFKSKLRMIKHKSVRYRLLNHHIHVL